MWLKGDANYTDFKLVEEKKNQTTEQPNSHSLKGSLTNNKPITKLVRPQFTYIMPFRVVCF